MVLYTVDSLLLNGERAIIGLTSGDFTYDIIDLLCNHKTPSITKIQNDVEQSNTIAYAPEPANLLKQYACLKHIQHGMVKDNACSELILSDNASAVEQIEIDIQATSWEPMQEQLLSSWLNYISTGFNDNIPYAYTHQKGDPTVLSDIYVRIIESKQNAIFTTDIDGYTVIDGFMHDGNLLCADDILTNDETRTKLKELLGYSPSGYVKTSFEQMYIYALADCSRARTLCIPTSMSSVSVELATRNYKRTNGISLADFFANDVNLHLINFEDINGEPEAIKQFKSLHNPRIYTMQVDGSTTIFAASIEGKYISLKDICRLQAAYEKIVEVLHISDIPCFVGPNLTFMLVLTDDLLQSEDVIFRSSSCLRAGTSPDIDSLYKDYSLVTHTGLAVDEITSSITLPLVENLTLTHFRNLRGDFQNIEAYTKAYSSLYPELVNEVQPTPTALLSRALPTYQQLKDIYGSAAIDNEDTEDEAASSESTENTTAFFTDELTGTSEAEVHLEDYSQLDMNINLKYMPLKTIFSYYDCVHYKNAIAALGINIDPTLIEGSATNNNLPIQENELKFYMGLRNLVIYGICVEQEIYTIGDIEKALAAGVSSAIVNAFLQDLTQDAYALNWAHTGHVLDDASDMNIDDTENEDAVYKGLPGRYYVTVSTSESGQRQEQVQYEQLEDSDFLSATGRFANFQPGMPRITAYASLEVKNSFTWIEIAIRLLRWGARKPNSLYVPSLAEYESGPRFLNMQTLITSGFSGTFSRLDVRKYGDEEASYIVDSAINFDVTENWASDISELNSNLGVNIESGDIIPCGVALSSTFLNLKDKTQYFYIDVFTLATQLSKGQIKVYGISYNQDAGEFVCTTEAKPVVVASGEPYEEMYIPEDSFSRNNTQLWTVLENVNSDPIVYTQSKCAYLVKYLRIMDEKLSSFKTNTVSIFDLIKLCATSIRWDCITECEQVLTIANNDERRDRASQIRAAYQLSSMNEVMTWMIFTEAVRPFLMLAERMRGRPRTLANILQEALAVQAQLDTRASSARSMQTNTSVFSFEQVLPKCVKYYKFTHTITNEDVCYAGVVDETPNSKIAIWMASEVSQLPDVQFESRPIQTFYNEWIVPILPYYRAAAQPVNNTDKSQQQAQLRAREQYQAQLKTRFIQASPKTFSSILKVCIDISKQLKAQKMG